MPVIGNMLLALYQGQKYIPSKENILCRLLKIALGPSKNSTLLCTFTERNDENENMLQLAAKIARAKKSSRRVKLMGDGTSLSSGSSRRGPRSEVESSSEAETVIFMGPIANGGSPSHRMPLRAQSSSSAHSVATLTGKDPRSTAISPSSFTSNKPLTSIPPLMKNHTPFFSPISRLYDDLCSPSTCDAPTPFYAANFDGDGLEPYVSPDHSPRRSKSRQSIDEEKRKAIFDWMDGHEAETADTAIQCGEGTVGLIDWTETDRDSNGKEPWLPQRPPLEDIIEMDEESMKSSIRSLKRSQTNGYISRGERDREALAQRDPIDHHPLSILSRDGLNKVSSTNDEPFKQEDGEDEDLERMMAASVNSMRSHEILSKVVAELQQQRDSCQTGSVTGTASEMDLYRRASQLEGYAAERIKQLDDERKKKKQKMLLNCCQQQSMTSSSSTVNNWEQLERKREKEEEKRRKEELRRKRDQLKAEEQELRRQREEITRCLDDHPPLIPPIAQSIARQITQQLHRFNIGTSPHRVPHALRPSDSLPSTPSISHRKLPTSHIPRAPSLSNIDSKESSIRENGRITSQNGKPLCFQPLAPKTNTQMRHPSFRKDSRESRKSSSKTRSRERRGGSDSQKEEISLRSPYAKVTEAKKESGCGSSGRGSDDNASGIATHQLKRSASYRNRNRDSYSASSGYESAADYHRFNGMDRLRMLPKRSTSAVREIEQLKEVQRRLRKELTAAHDRLGQPSNDLWTRDHDLSLASPQTIVDTLKQENRILEKRLLACQNHCMLVTAFV